MSNPGIQSISKHLNRANRDGVSVSGWMGHKCKFDDDSLLTLLEEYRYLGRKQLPALLKFLNSKIFEWTDDASAFPRIFNIQMSVLGKVHTGQGKPPYNVTSHEYYTHFARVALHRKQPYLIRIYECTSNLHDGVKLEIKFIGKKTGLKNPHHKLRAMREIRQRIDRRFPLCEGQRYIDHSDGVPIENLVKLILKMTAQKKPDVHRRLADYIGRKGGIKKISDIF